MATSASRQPLLAMRLARSRSHRKQTSSMLHWQTEEPKTLTTNMPCIVGAHVAHSPTGLATASAKRRIRSSALGRRSRLSLEAGTCAGIVVLGDGMLRVITPKLAEYGHYKHRLGSAPVLFVQAWLGRSRLFAQDNRRGASWIPRAAHLRWLSSEHRVGAQSHRHRKCLQRSSGGFG